MKHAVIGLSGGVDSALSAALLQEHGYQVTAVFMKNWEDTPDSNGHCSQAQDLKDALWIAEHLRIPLYPVDFSAAYWEEVFEDFLQELAAGRTPNPDIGCNRSIKFKWLKQYAADLGADCLATGHYAQLETDPDTGKIALCKAADPLKDQTYFLYALTQSQLAQVQFPLGHWTKSDVRAAARARGLPVSDKKDSTGICFIGEKRFRDFLQTYLPIQPGLITTPEGEPLGEHQGVAFYTLGQRHGLGIGGRKGSNGQPFYVARKDLHTNQLVVVQDPLHPLLWTTQIQVGPIHWIAGNPPRQWPWIGTGKIRYRQQEEPLSILPHPSGIGYTICFERPQRAPTPGQALVIYQDHRCIGGGIIQAS